MLKHLHIRDFAIIDELQLDFAPGMTVLTGETGAGKSILIDALGLLLGDRAEAGVVRHGSERAEINAEFDLDDAPVAKAWLDERELRNGDDPTQCLIRRSISADGRGRAFINGSPATVRDLKQFGETLLDIHGQHAHQSLLRAEVQRELLDAFGGHDPQLTEIHALYEDWSETQAEIQRLSAAGADPQRIEFLGFQLNELKALNLKPGEAEELDTEHRRISHSGQLLEDGQRVLALLYDDEQASAHRFTAQAQQVLEQLSRLDPTLGELGQTLTTPLDLLREVAEQMRDRLEGLDLDPERLQWLDSRLSALHALARKHRCRPEELPALQAQIADELNGLESSGARIEELRQITRAQETRYGELAARLSAARRKTAKRLAAEVQALLRQLGMSRAIFEIAIDAGPETKPHPQGADRIEYRVSANPGQSPGALDRVASGGELSRIALAIQVVGVQQTQVPSLIFDEVDSGVGGAVAEIVGRQLALVGKARQTLCVTHLAQVAAQADQQLQVRKEVRTGQTYTRVEPLNAKARVDEIARMLGGVEITAQTRALAQQMLKKAG